MHIFLNSNCNNAQKTDDAATQKFDLRRPKLDDHEEEDDINLYNGGDKRIS